MHKHRFDPGALVAGLFFLAVAGIFLVGGFADTSILPVYGLAPAVLIGLGAVGLVRALTRARRRGP
ncbi:MAG: hypothetical protein JWL58_6497 [Streptosporangiaceae bacterium]|nr:hypothetical protein [Streptosporangiaceae bacterium]